MVNLKYLLPTASLNKKGIIIYASCCLILQNADWILFLIKIKPKNYFGFIGQHLSRAKWKNNNILPGIKATFSVKMMTLLLNFWAFHTMGGTISFSNITYSVLKIFQANQRYLKILDNTIWYVREIIESYNTNSYVIIWKHWLHFCLAMVDQPFLFVQGALVSHVTVHTTYMCLIFCH